MLAICAITRVGLTTAALVSSAAVMAQGQTRDSVAVLVQVVDSVGSPVMGANVAVRLRNGPTIAQAVTDKNGTVTVAILRNAVIPEVFVRHVGFRPYSQVLPLPLDDSNTVHVMLVGLSATLDTVKVNARESLWHRTYYIDSTAIAQSPRLVQDGWDILKKLRPEIAFGRDPWDNCPAVQNVFINGKWIVPQWISLDPVVVARETPPPPPPDLSRTGGGVGRGHVSKPITPPSMVAINVMALIKPEHIAELSYRDCRDKEIAGSHSRNAVFVILKPGIGFDPAQGSYVVKP